MKKLTSTSKKKPAVANAKKKPLKPGTEVATVAAKKVVKPETTDAKKTEAQCKPEKDEKLPTDCKVEAVAKPTCKADRKAGSNHFCDELTLCNFAP